MPHLVLDRRIGSGGQGEVWRARDERRGQWVAIKVLRPQPHWRQLARFEQEARLLQMLDHRGLVRLIDANLATERPWLELELVEGETLREVIVRHLERRVVVSLSWAALVIDQVCDALEYAHARSIVHRDLKPSNVIVRTGWPPTAKLIDLGIAKWLGQHTTQATTISQGFIGSLGYMAPEQLLSAPVDERTDVHQLAVLVFTLLAGRLPWVEPGELLERLQPPMLAQRIATSPRPTLSRWREDAPIELDGILARAMAIDPAARFANVAAFRFALAGALRSVSQERMETIATTPEMPLSSLLDSDQLAAILTARAVTVDPVDLVAAADDDDDADDPTRRIDERDVPGVIPSVSQVGIPPPVTSLAWSEPADAALPYTPVPLAHAARWGSTPSGGTPLVSRVRTPPPALGPPPVTGRGRAVEVRGRPSAVQVPPAPSLTGRTPAPILAPPIPALTGGAASNPRTPVPALLTVTPSEPTLALLGQRPSGPAIPSTAGLAASLIAAAAPTQAALSLAPREQPSSLAPREQPSSLEPREQARGLAASTAGPPLAALTPTLPVSPLAPGEATLPPGSRAALAAPAPIDERTQATAPASTLGRAWARERGRLAWPIAVTVWGLVALVYVWRMPVDRGPSVPRVTVPPAESSRADAPAPRPAR